MTILVVLGLINTSSTKILYIIVYLIITGKYCYIPAFLKLSDRTRK
jgi:hypothetical protein